MESLLNIKDRLLPSSNYDLDWQFISAMQQVLKPVSTLTTQSQAEQYLAGDFKRDYAIMRFAFEKLRMHAESATVLSMIEEMKLCLRSRESAFDHPAFLAALYLDPRYNNVNNTANLKKMTREQLDVGRVSFSLILLIILQLFLFSIPNTKLTSDFLLLSPTEPPLPASRTIDRDK